MSKAPHLIPRPYAPTRVELDEIAHDYCRAAQSAARAEDFETCEAYLELYGKAREQLDRLDEIDLDIPISVEHLDARLFASA
jgi:hypothetical protein